MLSRTADHLYWMARYVERAEHLARMLDAHYPLSLLPRPHEALLQGWQATLTSLGMEGEFLARHARWDVADALNWLAWDRGHPGSIMSCLAAARENARAVRGTITNELWETINSTWLESRGLRPGTGYQDVAAFIEWVKDRSHLTRGVTVGTMLRDEAYRFASIGTFIERADGTTRLLEARWRDPGGEGERLATEASEWSLLLRALSGFEVYRKVYRESVTPWRVTELLLMNPELPSSVHRCLRSLLETLASVRNNQSAETERLAGALHAQFRYGRLADLCEGGVAQFLDRLQDRLNRLADGIATDFLAAGQAA